LNSWFAFTQDQKDLIISYFLRNLRRISVALQAKDFLENFGDEYYANGLDWKKYNQEQTIELWNLWCITFSEFFIRIPPKYLEMEEGRMEYSMNQFVKHVQDPQLRLELFKAWNDWLVKCKCPTDYGMCVMEYILQYILSTFPGRELLLCEMIKVSDTSILTCHVKHIVDNWDCITSSEKQKFYELIFSNRKDTIWIKAVTLTRKSVPLEIQKSFCISEISESTTIEFVETLRNIQILENCLNVYCGYPQPLWWNGYHHCYCKLWDMVIMRVLESDIIDQSYEISLREFLESQEFKNNRFGNYSNEIWGNILSNYQKREHTLSRLIKISTRQSQTIKQIWVMYLNACNSHEKDIAYKKVAEFIEILQYYQDGDAGILDLFDKDIIFKHIYPLLENDTLILKTCDIFRDFDNSIGKSPVALTIENGLQIGETLEKALMFLYEITPPRMTLTNLIVKNTMDKICLSSELLNKLIQENHSNLKCKVEEQRQQLDDHYELSNWNWK